VDGAGDVFIATYSSDVLEETPSAGGGYTQTTLTLPGDVSGVAVDAAGDLFIANGALTEGRPNGSGGYSFSEIESADPGSALAVDGAGDLFYVDGPDTAYSRALERPAPGPPVAASSTIAASATSLPANGVSSATITVTTADANGFDEPVGGATVTMHTTAGTLSAVTDDGDGTYSAALTSSVAGATAVVTATVDGAAIPDGEAVVTFTASPRVTGTAQDGQVLTKVSEGTWSLPAPLTFTDQWMRCEATGADCVAIAGATGDVYRLTAADVGHDVTVEVTATDSASQSASASAAPLGPVAAPPPPSNTSAPAISGASTVGSVLTKTGEGTWSSPDRLAFTDQWMRCTASGTGCVAIPGATGSVYRLTAADVGDEVTVQVTATDGEGQTGTARAAAIGPVTAS
jgi:adhesin/invasin